MIRRKRFPASLAADLGKILSSTSTLSTGDPEPFLRRWRLDACRFLDDDRTLLEVAVSRDDGESLRLLIHARDFVGSSYAKPFPGEEEGMPYPPLPTNLSGLIQETIVPRRGGQEEPLRLRR